MRYRWLNSSCKLYFPDRLNSYLLYISYCITPSTV